MDKPQDTNNATPRCDETQALARSSGPTAREPGAAGAVPESCSAPSSWGSLKVLQKLGAGAFGEVFEAWDPVLERSVALKLLRKRPGQPAQDWDAALREGRLLARIRHPSIVQVFGVDVVEGRVGICMELVQGTTLEKWLALHGPFSAREAMGIGIELCRALAAVHREGLTHGDIKSQNVIREAGGRIVLMDFGLGRLRAEQIPPEEASTGGTPLYMAPELLSGSSPGTASDVYALGVLLFHLVTGRFPVTALTLGELRERHSRGEVDSLRDLRPDIPEQFAAVVERAVAPDPAARFPTAGQMERAILNALGAEEAGIRPSGPSVDGRGHPAEESGKLQADRRPPLAIWTAACVLLLAAVIFMWFRWSPETLSRTNREGPARNLPSQRHLAVLPFRNLGGDAAGQALCDGLVETLTSRLTSIEQFQGSLWIVPSTEVWDKQVNSVADARRHFGVTLAVTGSIQTGGDALSVTVNLVDAGSLRQIDSSVFQQASAAPGLQQDIVQAVAEMLELRLQPEEKRRLSDAGTKVAEAYELYLRGRGYLQRYDRPVNLEKAVLLLQQAIDTDPSYALAHAGLAEAYFRKYEDSRDRAHLDRAAALCRRSVSLDPTIAPVYAVLGMIQSAAGEYGEALESYSRALGLDPYNSAAFRGLATTYEKRGLFVEAENTYKRAIELRPQLWSGYNELGVFYTYRGRYADAIRQFRHVVRLSPDNARGYFNLGALFHYTGDMQQAEAMLKKSLDLWETPEGHTNLGTVYYFQGRHREAVDQMEKAVKLGGGDYRLWGNLANSYERIGGALDRSRAAYEKAIEKSEQQLRTNPADGEVRAHLAYYLAKTGRRERAAREVGEAVRPAGASGSVLFRSALALETLGQRRRALETLARALAAGHSLQEIENAPDLEHLRSDPEYASIVRKQLESPRKGN